MKRSCKLEHIWLHSVRGSSCARLPMFTVFTGISLVELVGTEEWDATVGKDKLSVWIQCSEIYKFPLFPESHHLFLSSWCSEGVSLFLNSRSFDTCSNKAKLSISPCFLFIFSVPAAAYAKWQPLISVLESTGISVSLFSSFLCLEQANIR